MALDRKDLPTDEKETELDPIKDQDKKEMAYHPFEDQDDNDLVEDLIDVMREICRTCKVWEVSKMWNLLMQWRERKNQNSEDVFEFYAINRRITHQFCLPILDRSRFIYYCAFAKLPGVWVASSLRRDDKKHVVDKKPIDKTNLVYSRKEHIVESCLRVIIGKQFENLFGRCNYSMTYYMEHDKNYLLRVSMPHDKEFMIIFNVYENFLDDFRHLFSESYWKIMREPVSLDELKKSVRDMFESIDKSKKAASQHKMEDHANAQLKQYVNLDELKECTNLDELKKLCRKALQLRQSQPVPDGPTYPLFATHHQPFLSIFLKSCFRTSSIIRTATIGTIDGGVIFGHYAKENLTALFGKHDLYEYFVEFASRIKMRRNIEQFFGNVNFVLTVYDNVAVMAIPIEIKQAKTKDETQNESKDRFLLLLSLETEIKKDGETIGKDQIYFPTQMNEICKFISEQKMEYLTTGL